VKRTKYMARPAESASNRLLEQVLRKLLQASGQPSPASTETPSGSHPEQELVAAFAEGRLRGRELQSVESHLAACLLCRRSATALFESLGNVERPRSQAIFEWRRWMRPAPVLAAALIVGSMLYYQRGQILRRGVQPARSNAQNGLAPASGQTEAAGQKTQEAGAAVRRDSNAAQNSPGLRNGNQAKAVERVERTAPGNGGVIAQVAGAAAVAPQGARAASGGAPQDGNTVLLKEEAEQAAARAQQSPIQNKPLSGKAEENRGPDQAPVPRAEAPLAREGSEKGQPPALKKTFPAPAASPARSRAFSAGVVGGIAGGWLEPVAALPGGAPLRAMIAHDNRTWAVSDSGKIFRSLDSGRTWIAIPSPTAEDLVSIRWDPATNSLMVRDKQGREYQAQP